MIPNGEGTNAIRMARLGRINKIMKLLKIIRLAKMQKKESTGVMDNIGDYFKLTAEGRWIVMFIGTDLPPETCNTTHKSTEHPIIHFAAHCGGGCGNSSFTSLFRPTQRRVRFLKRSWQNWM